jgi:hypothetical protein
MERRGFGAGDTRSQFHPRRPETMWLYDPVTEEFRRDPGSPRRPWQELDGDLPGPFAGGLPDSRARRLVRWLFVNGGMSVVLIFGLMLSGLIAAAIGFK